MKQWSTGGQMQGVFGVPFLGFEWDRPLHGIPPHLDLALSLSVGK